MSKFLELALRFRVVRPTVSEPNCRYYERRQCDGCTALDQPYAKQLARKQAFVAECLKPLGSGHEVEKIVPSPLPMGYRSSVKLCLSEDRDHRRSIGLYRTGSKDVAHIPGCPAQSAEINKLADKLFYGKCVRLPARLYDHRGRVFQRNRLKFATIRAVPGAPLDQHGMVIAHTGVDRDSMRSWLKSAGLQQLCVYESKLTPRDGDQTIGYHLEHLSGPPHFAFPLAGTKFEIAPASFFQANFALSDGLIAGATAFAEDGDVLLDLYGGFGAYAMSVRHRFKDIHVVDGNSAAIAAALRVGAKNVTGHAGYCEAFMDKLDPATAARVTHIIVNPPRNGLSRRVAEGIGRKHFPALKEVRYVSCNPYTLARDLGAMTESGGLRLRGARPYDMFPQTEHVETVARLT